MKLSTQLLLLALLSSHTIASEGTFDPDLLDDEDDPEARIVGGNAASRGEYKFFAKWSGCGASLIAPDILLTAAHVSILFCFIDPITYLHLWALALTFSVSFLVSISTIVRCFEEQLGTRRSVDTGSPRFTSGFTMDGGYTTSKTPWLC
jgi:hypothetical protein